MEERRAATSTSLCLQGQPGFRSLVRIEQGKLAAHPQEWERVQVNSERCAMESLDTNEDCVDSLINRCHVRVRF